MSSTETEASRQLVLDFYDATRSSDRGAVEKVLADDVEWVPPQSSPLDGPFRGRDLVLAEMSRAVARFFDATTFHVQTRKMIAEGDTVVVLQTVSCKAANGRDYSNEYLLVFTCASGRIVRIEEHMDTLRFQRIAIDDG